jgi:hypothetical protein
VALFGGGRRATHASHLQRYTPNFVRSRGRVVAASPAVAWVLRFAGYWYARMTSRVRQTLEE